MMKRIYLERRKQRSHTIIQALRYFMESASQKQNLRALVLADMDGLVVSEYHGDPSVRPEEIASYCPLIVKVGGSCYDGRLPSDYASEFSMLLFMYHDQPLYLVAVGGDGSVYDTLLSVMQGVHRILGN
jgi:hypothetical protein